MHQEVSKRSKYSMAQVIVFILFSYSLIHLINYVERLIGIPSAIADINTLILISVSTYLFMRRHLTCYKYICISDEFIVQEIIGKKGKVILNINKDQIDKIGIIKNSEKHKDKKVQYKFKKKLYNSYDKECYYCIYNHNNKKYYFEFKPSVKMIEMLERDTTKNIA